MGEGDHELAVFDRHEGDGLLEARGQKLQETTSAAMLLQRTKRMSITKRGKQMTGGFHAGIIALLLMGMALAGCGYKTAPVYVSSPDQNRTVPNP